MYERRGSCGLDRDRALPGVVKFDERRKPGACVWLVQRDQERLVESCYVLDIDVLKWYDRIV